MIYILFGSQYVMIKNHINKIVKESLGNDSGSIIKIDCQDNDISNLITELTQTSLFDQKKMIIVNNCFFLSTSKGYSLPKKDSEYLLESLKQLDDDVEVLFVLNDINLNKKNEICTYVSKSGKILEFKDLEKGERPIFIRNYFSKRNINIEEEAISELNVRSKGDLGTFFNEAQKLIMYKTNNIRLNDVINLVPNSLDDDAFKILNSLLSNDKSSALKVYNDLKCKSVEPIALISLISSSLFFMLLVKRLLNGNSKVETIAKLTNSSTGRIYMTIKNVKYISEEQLCAALNKLYLLDKTIKHNEVDRFLALELFIANY